MSSNSPLEDVQPRVRDLLDEIVQTRRDIHRHPELGFKEKRTAELISARLASLGIPVKRLAGTGVVGLIQGGKPGKTILIRADMDALPLQEENETDYRSEVPSVMHACGHDAHVATALATARLLNDEKENLRGNVKFMFQPAEEKPGGAKPMIREGVLKSPDVDAAIGLHVWNSLPVGKVAIRPGPIMAAADEVTIKVIGKGGHGAAAYQAIDPVVIAAHLVTALQSVASREVDPLQSVVLSICSIHAGHAFNIIPPSVDLRGTVRSFDSALRQELPGRIERIVKGVTSAFGATYEFDYRMGYPPTVNDVEISALVDHCAEELVSVREVIRSEISMGGEDMSYILNEVPGCFFFLGTQNAEKGFDFPHHSPRFDIDESALPIGAEIFQAVVHRYLETTVLDAELNFGGGAESE